MTNELTDVRCPCGTEFPAESYDAGFIAGSGMCQNCDAALPPKDICTCPSGDGSLRHPCPAHPAVEQAGGDERVIGWRERILAAHPNSDPGFWTDALLVEHMAAEIADLRAALAHPSPTQAEQHWPKLEQPAKVGGVRFSAGVSSRLVVEAAQRLYKFESTPEKEAERIERLQAFREQLDPLNLAPHAEAFNEAPDEALRPEQAEAERPELWAVHAQGPDELYAAFTREDAEKHAAELNALPMPEGIAVGAVVVPSPWPAVQHWQYLAEQEQDHKNEIAGRLRQLERICEGLPQDAIDGGWTVQGIRGYAKRLEDQLKAAQAEVEALRAELQSQRERNTELIFKLGSATNGWGRCEKERDAALARVAEFEAQAQHSVPEGWKLVPSDKGCVTSSMKAECIGEFSFYIRAACAECLDVGTDSDCHVCGGDIEYDQKIDVPWDTCKEIYKTMLAAAPGKAQHSVPEVSGIGRDFAYPRSVVLYLRTEPTDDDLRAIHDGLRSLAAAPGKEGV
ncbi:hypothetical protein RVS57_001444 [Pseudomonas aeruginosa]|uniref:hypothetical protein n=1 Tax=Pseudomonas aeruginosa TaxID=287 RepID=UPI001782D00C|nr:hypothetical protein [Pseudomonas aeruginosa]ELK4727182.1 hypothetical protein [Pseudomonas aeruginosa]ELK4883839.1 hypothetical protein [Pseudomonas aeruginosa]MCW5353476.1 hypothetical protein [Pseudomonas aeruginosa]MCW5370993.1 hypothetical protein [Pseudomonas aeruginosa]MCW5443519.1 hypothetical protein [Pseudomonas aeruginosa]